MNIILNIYVNHAMIPESFNLYSNLYADVKLMERRIYLNVYIMLLQTTEPQKTIIMKYYSYFASHTFSFYP